MLNTRRSWQTPRAAQFLLTVQLDPPAGGHTAADHERLPHVTRDLIALANAHRLPATWAVSDPAHSAATPMILRSEVAHELAILGDANWLGPTAGRTRFARELARRVLQARAAGLRVTTLVPRVAAIDRDIDLVVKQGITAVAGTSSSTSHRASPPLRALHYGVWEVPATVALPAPATWFSSGGWTVWRRIRRASRDAALFHLLIDAPTVAQRGPRAERTISWLMKRVGEWRDRGRLSVLSLAAAAAQWSDTPAAAPQQSILRKAA